MLPREINLGPLTIHLYGFVIAVSIYIGWLLAKKRASIYKQSLRSSSINRRTAGLKIPQSIFEDWILLIPLVLGIAGARLYHVLDYWSYYSSSLISILKISDGGLGIWGGLAGMIIGFWIVAKIRKLDILSSLDLVAPSILLGQVIGRFANYINQEGFGPPTDKPWGVFIDQAHRPLQYFSYTRFHPTFFYEAVINFIFFLILMYWLKKSTVNGQLSVVKGRTFALYLIFYSTSRFITEFWRINTWVIGQVKVAHVFSIVSFMIGIVLLIFSRKKLFRS